MLFARPLLSGSRSWRNGNEPGGVHSWHLRTIGLGVHRLGPARLSREGLRGPPSRASLPMGPRDSRSAGLAAQTRTCGFSMVACTSKVLAGSANGEMD
jgi:hypothetical protein